MNIEPGGQAVWDLDRRNGSELPPTLPTGAVQKSRRSGR